MIGLISGILLIIIGSALGMRRERRGAGELSRRWRYEDLPKHEKDQAVSAGAFRE